MDEIPDAVREAFPDINKLIVHYQTCDTMGKCLLGGPMELRTLNSAFKRVARDDYWKLRYDPQRNCLLDYRDKDFVTFLRDPYPQGMDTDVETLRKVLDGEALVMLETLLAAPQGGSNNPEGVNQHGKEESQAGEVNHSSRMVDLQQDRPVPQQGTTRQYTIRRLHKQANDPSKPDDHPDRVLAADLLAKIGREEVSCNAAAKAAGFRKDPTPLEIVLKNLPKLDPADRLVVAQRLSELCQGKDSP